MTKPRLQSPRVPARNNCIEAPHVLVGTIVQEHQSVGVKTGSFKRIFFMGGRKKSHVTLCG